MLNAASIIQNASHFATSSNSKHKRDVEEGGGGGGDNLNDNVDEQTTKSCISMTLACWLASLTFVILIVQNILSSIRDLVTNDSFWDSANRLIGLYDHYNVSVINHKMS